MGKSTFFSYCVQLMIQDIFLISDKVKYCKHFELFLKVRCEDWYNLGHAHAAAKEWNNSGANRKEIIQATVNKRAVL